MKDTSLSQKREKLERKIEAFQDDLRALHASPDGKECGFLVLFPDELENSESLVARVFANLATVEASVFVVTEELMDTFDRLDSKYVKLQKKAAKELISQKEKKISKDTKEKESKMEEKAPTKARAPKPKKPAPKKKAPTRTPAKKTPVASRKK